jgi:Chalcone isomerase-like
MHLSAATRRSRLLLRPLLALVVLALLTPGGARAAWALERGADGWFHTGDGVRVKRVLFASFEVFSISHDMKDLPATKSKRAVIELDTDKRFTWRMLRDVEAEKIETTIREAFAANGCADASKIGPYLAAFSGDRKKGQVVTIVYDSTSQAVTVTVQGGGTATIAGVDFMKVVWSFWFGNNDQPALGDDLLRNL